MLHLHHDARWHVVGPGKGTGFRTGYRQHSGGTKRGGGNQLCKKHRSPFSVSSCGKLFPESYLNPPLF